MTFRDLIAKFHCDKTLPDNKQWKIIVLLEGDYFMTFSAAGIKECMENDVKYFYDYEVIEWMINEGHDRCLTVNLLPNN